MKGLDKYNIIQMLNRDLERNIKDTAIETITKKFLGEYEAKIRPAIKEEVERMTFSGIDQMQDVLQVRNEFRLYIKWSDEEAVKVKES